MASNPIPRTGHVGARGTREYGHVCGKCRQPITNRGREDCPNNQRASQTVPYIPDEYDLPCTDRNGNRCMECPDCEQYLEDNAVDLLIDRLKEERAFGD